MALTMFTLTLLVASSWATPHESVLHSFNNNGQDGWYPDAGLVLDGAGNLYGTTFRGGIHSELSCWHGLRVVAQGGWGLDGDGAAQFW